MNLTTHFTLEEFSFSAIAARKGINNGVPANLIPNLIRTANGLEKVRQELNNNPIHVNSAYRCKALERVLCADAFLQRCKNKGIAPDDRAWSAYFATKQHPTGNAVDFTCPTYGSPERVVRRIMAAGIRFDQLILEFDSWVHISFADILRNQVLVIDSKGTRSFS